MLFRVSLGISLNLRIYHDVHKKKQKPQSGWHVDRY